MEKSKIERRNFIRIKDNLKAEIVTNKLSINSYTKNISASGVMCWSAEPISLMSKVKIVLSVPSYKTISSRKIDCYGIVVRFEPSNLNRIEEGYNVAIQFSDITKDDQSTIDTYVRERLKEIV